MVDVVGTKEAVVVEENIALKNPSKLLLSIFLGVLKEGFSWKWWVSRELEKLSSSLIGIMSGSSGSTSSDIGNNLPAN